MADFGYLVKIRLLKINNLILMKKNNDIKNFVDKCILIRSIFSHVFFKYFIQVRFVRFKVLILLVLFSFTSKNSIEFGLPVIDLTKIPEKENTVNISRFVSKITYLPLETNEECLIGTNAKFYLYDSIIVCCAFRQIFIFNSKDGKFIKSIGEYGRGPTSFSNSRNSYIKNGDVLISALNWEYPLIEFSVNGTVLNRLKTERYPRDIAWLNDNLYAIYYNKNSISDSLKLQIYNSKNRKTVSTFYDYREFKDSPKRTMFGAFFYNYNNKLFIKEYFNDTVFRVTSEKLIPNFVFHSGKYSPPFYEKDVFDFVQYHSINTIIETEHLIFFRLHFKKQTYYCYFDKLTDQVQIPNYKNSKINGFNNDIDGFMKFSPLTVSENNELIGYLESYKIKQWFKENPDKAAKLPPHLQKLKNIKETDNPVVIIAKLKD